MYILAGSEAAGTLDRDDAADGRRVLGGRRSSFSSVVCRPLWRSWFRVQGSLSVDGLEAVLAVDEAEGEGEVEVGVWRLRREKEEEEEEEEGKKQKSHQKEPKRARKAQRPEAD
ncbi:hypothetical protein TESG_07937 [Trichophyton tonsurans CBS 112818]|uniref:Uncharacterized protein n=1 Tax=Trichophyton tonsurans (strain CBS 112818) TaxID=647933 RepID=F2SAN8_TRIT1|nr:hypothetical protein TESG_07937 [Trichophyton tonsurans CBS 112818]